jgi:outer membrane protein assembly factor BamA
MSAAAFVDAGSLFGAGAGAKALNTQCGIPLSRIPRPGRVLNPGICLADSSAVRASAGASIIWESPLGPCGSTFPSPSSKSASTTSS